MIEMIVLICIFIYIMMSENFLDQIFVNVIIIKEVGSEQGIMCVYEVWVIMLEFYIIYYQLDCYIVIFGIVDDVFVEVVQVYYSLV